MRFLLMPLLLLFALSAFANTGNVSSGAANGVAVDDAKVVSASSIPYKQRADIELPSVTKVFVVLVLLALFVVAVSVLLKKGLVHQGRLPASTGTHIQILDRKNLHAGHHIYLLDVDGRRILSQIGPQYSQLLLLDAEMAGVDEDGKS